MPIDQISKSRSYIPNDADWKVIYDVLPGNPAVINPHFECIEVTGNTVLPANGMYIVLRGVVQLRQNGNPLASADVGDYFYEEHLQISDIPVSLEALCAGRNPAGVPVQQELASDTRKHPATLFCNDVW